MASETPQDLERRLTVLLHPYLGDPFVVNYDPSFPRPDGSTFSLFQVVFVVGPGDDATVRAMVHRRFVQLLELLAVLPEAQRSEFMLRARRHVPPRSPESRPQMFIECFWHGDELRELCDDDFAVWHSYCYSYINRFDDADPLNIDRRSDNPA